MLGYLGKNITAAAPGSAQGLYLAVSDIEAARNELLRRGVDVSEIFHAGNEHLGRDEPFLFGRLRVSGPDPGHGSYRSFASFHDPDGNGWLFAESLAKGHTLGVLTRSPEKARALVKRGIEPSIADVFDRDAVKAVVRRAQPEIVIEQLTALPKTYTRQSLSAAAFNNRIRLEGGANVLAAAQAAGVRRYLRQSIAFWAVPGPGLADEQTPLAFNASPAVAADAHLVTELERSLLGNSNIEGIALRYGFFYGPGTWFNPDGDVAQQVRQRQFPIVGNGEGVWSWLHIEDAALATMAAAEQGNPGIYLIANDQPLAVREWLPAFATWLNAPPPPQISVADALKTSGADAVYYATQMRGVSNDKAKRELNFRPRPLEWSVDTFVAHGGPDRVPARVGKDAR